MDNNYKKIVDKINEAFSGKEISSFVFIRDYYQLIEEDYECLTIYSDIRIYKGREEENLFDRVECVKDIIGRRILCFSSEGEDYLLELDGEIVIKFNMFGPVDGGFAGDYGGEF